VRLPAKNNGKFEAFRDVYISWFGLPWPEAFYSRIIDWYK
jgi:hypothetical protein